MQRTMAVALALAVLAGCRSSQQPINPFIRTTVPPPGTGEAAVVVPGDPYYPGSTPTPSPQMITPTTPPPAAAAVPVTPVPAQPAQPPTRDLKRSVPGGDLFYHQSSRESPRQLDADNPDADNFDRSSLAVNAADPDALVLGGKSNAVAEAVALSRQPQPIPAAHFEDYGGRLPGETPLAGATRSEPPSSSAPTRLQYSSQQRVRMVGHSEDDSEDYEVDESALEYNSSSQEQVAAHGGLA